MITASIQNPSESCKYAGSRAQSQPAAAAAGLLLILLLFCLLTGCAKSPVAEYGEMQITVSVDGAEYRSLTVEELSRMEITEETAVGQTAKAGTRRGHGPTIQTVLAELGLSPDQVKSVRFCASDGYEVVLTSNTWDSHTVILSVQNGEEALEESERPLRLVIPGAESSKWIRSVERLEITMKDGGKKHE